MLHDFTLRTDKFKPRILRFPAVIDVPLFSPTGSGVASAGLWSSRTYRHTVDLEKLFLACFQYTRLSLLQSGHEPLKIFQHMENLRETCK